MNRGTSTVLNFFPSKIKRKRIVFVFLKITGREIAVNGIFSLWNAYYSSLHFGVLPFLTQYVVVTVCVCVCVLQVICSVSDLGVEK